MALVFTPLIFTIIIVIITSVSSVSVGVRIATVMLHHWSQ